MSSDLIRAKKNHCYSLIKQISDLYSSEDSPLRKEYALSVIENHQNKLDELIDCLADIHNGAIAYAKALNLPVVERSKENRPRGRAKSIVRPSRLCGLLKHPVNITKN